MRGRDGLGVGRRRPVVEVDLGPVLVCGRAQDLLGTGPSGPVRSEADHPAQEDQQDQEDDATGDTTRDVRKVRFLLAVLACKKCRIIGSLDNCSFLLFLSRAFSHPYSKVANPYKL